MPLNIHQGCRDSIKAKLVEHLPTIEVNNKKFLKRESTAGFLVANESLPKHGPILDELNSIIGEWPLYDFLYGFLSKELNDQQEYSSEDSLLKLNEIDKYSDIEATSNRLVEQFNSLPWRYRFTIDIKSSLAPYFSGNAVFNITNTIRITRPDENFISAHPLEGSDGRTSRGLIGLGTLKVTEGLKNDQFE